MRLTLCGLLASLAAFAMACAVGRSAAPDASSSSGDVEAVSLLGQPLHRAALFKAPSEKLRNDLELAERNLREHPDDPDALIWVGRRLAYLGRVREAIERFSEGIVRFPADARFYRHRGHRYLTIRKIDLALADFEKAAELVRGQADAIEPDGAPNAKNIPRSSLQSNIWYHLGLARFLKGDFAGAEESFRTARDVLANDDNRVASTHWLWASLSRQGKAAEAEAVLEGITPTMDVIESQGYHRLLLLYKGLRTPEELLAGAGGEEAGDAAVVFGVGHWHLVQGRKGEAEALFRSLAARPGWTAFGVLAAEAELARAAAVP